MVGDILTQILVSDTDGAIHIIPMAGEAGVTAMVHIGDIIHITIAGDIHIMDITETQAMVMDIEYVQPIPLYAQRTEACMTAV